MVDPRTGRPVGVRVDTWGRRGSIGGRHSYGPDSIPFSNATQLRSIIDVAANDSRDTEPYSIVLSSSCIPDPVVANPNGSIGFFARVEWGSDAYSESAEVDIGRGTQLTIAGSTCRVAIAWDGSFGPLDFASTAGGQISRGVRANNPWPVQRTVRVSGVVLLNADPLEIATRIQIPAFSVSLARFDFSVVSAGAGLTGDFVLAWRDCRDRVVGQTTIGILEIGGIGVPDPASVPYPIVLPAGARTFSAIWTGLEDPAPTLFFSQATFQLSL